MVASPKDKEENGSATQVKEKRPSDSGMFIPFMLLLVVSAVVAVLAMEIQNNPKFKAAIFDFFPESVVFKVEDLTGWSLSARGFKPPTEISAQDEKPLYPVSFTVHFNGDGLSEGVTVSSSEYDGLDDMIRLQCMSMAEAEKMSNGSPSALRRICDPSEGARLYTDTGRRAYSFKDIKQGQRTYIVPQGVNYVWALGKVGDYYYPEMVDSPIPGHPIRLKQLSMSPRVFTVENFMSEEEMQAILDHNRDLVKPSEVGFAGWRDSTRTSWTAWDFHSWAAKKIQRRSFDLLSMEFRNDMADAVQVLKYGKTEWYKPHTDWFDDKAYDGHDPTVGNGTNRFATVFLYLTNVDEGGHTVFPLSTTHAGYNGEELVHPGTENTPGYISQRDAEWVCNTSSTALRSNPVAGSAVLFYSQGPDGSLDKYSLHGGCPVIKGVKWSANVWVWNRPKPGKEKAKDGKPKHDDSAIQMHFKNARDGPVTLYWDDGSEEGVYQSDIEPGHLSPMTTYHGHAFFARDKSTGEKVFNFQANDKHKGEEYVAQIN